MLFRVSPDILTITGNPDVGNWEMDTELRQNLLSYTKKLFLPKFPLHLPSAYANESLHLVLHFDSESWISNYDCEHPITKSYKVYLHRPDEIRKAFNRPIEIEVGRKVIIYVKPSVIVSAKPLRKYDPKYRQCFFDSERQLKYFKVYTKSNCEHECLAEAIKEKCGCVKFSMPRKSQFNIISIYFKMTD